MMRHNGRGRKSALIGDILHHVILSRRGDNDNDNANPSTIIINHKIIIYPRLQHWITVIP
jgi:hypothetical protein